MVATDRDLACPVAREVLEATAKSTARHRPTAEVFEEQAGSVQPER